MKSTKKCKECKKTFYRKDMHPITWKRKKFCCYHCSGEYTNRINNKKAREKRALIKLRKLRGFEE